MRTTPLRDVPQLPLGTRLKWIGGPSKAKISLYQGSFHARLGRGESTGNAVISKPQVFHSADAALAQCSGRTTASRIVLRVRVPEKHWRRYCSTMELRKLL